MKLEVILDSLQARNIARLLEPGRLPWKAFFLTNFGRSTQLTRLQYGAL